jgi:integrase
MIGPAKPATVGEYARRYELFRDVRPETLRQYRIVADLFERWSGGPFPLVSLDEATVSGWLRDYAASGVAPATVRSKRVGILALWRGAADEYLCEPPTRRVRAVRVPWKPPVAWDYPEVVALLAAAAKLKRWHRCGLRRAVWFDLAIRVAWDSGLRWADQMRLRVADVRPNGTVAVTQSKTSRPVVFTLSPSTMERLAVSLAVAPRELVTPWPYSHETFDAQFRRLVVASGVRLGSWKWLRRASSTNVELQHRGGGAIHLGHAPGSRIADRHYNDPAILGRDVPTPRDLGAGPEADGPALTGGDPGQ